MLRSLSLAVACAMAATVTAESNGFTTEYPVMVSGFASQMDYSPLSYWYEAGDDLGWNATFLDTPPYLFSTSQTHLAKGQGVHLFQVPTTPNPPPVWVGYTFYGTGIEWWGYFGSFYNATAKGTVEVRWENGTTAKQLIGEGVDSSAKGWPPVKLIEVNDLPLGNHTVRLVPVNGTVSFTHVVVRMGMKASVKDLDKASANPTVHNFVIFDESGNPIKNPNAPVEYVEFDRDWQALPDLKDNLETVKFPRISTKQLHATCTITIPRGTAFMRLNGTSNYDHGQYELEWSPVPPPGKDKVIQYWTDTAWLLRDATLLATALDPEVEYKIKLTNVHTQDDVPDTRFTHFEMSSLELWEVPHGKSAPIGAIVGGVVGGLVVVIGIVVLVLYLRRRRQKKDDASVHEPGSRVRMEIDSDVPATTPYMPMSETGAQVSYNDIARPLPASPVQQLPLQQSPRLPLLATAGLSSEGHSGASPTSISPPGSTTTTSIPPTSVGQGSVGEAFANAGYVLTPTPGNGGYVLTPAPINAISQFPVPPVPQPFAQHSDAGSLHEMADNAAPPQYNADWGSSSTRRAALDGTLPPAQVPPGSFVASSHRSGGSSQRGVDVKSPLPFKS